MVTGVQDNTVSQSVLDSMNAKKTTQTTAEAAQDRFMTLLVTQMKNQDPLNPLDNAQVTSQLAQLSTVTGIDKLNTSLASLMSTYQTSQSLQSADMIGHGVLVPGKSVAMVDGGGVMGVGITTPADNVKVSILDASGNAIRTFDIGSQEVGNTSVQWDGKDDSGNTAPTTGTYTFAVAATRGGVPIAADTLQFGMVNTVETSTSGIKLNLQGLGAFSLSDVRQIL